MIEKLIEIEAEDKILDFRFRHNNLPMWLFIRTNVFWQKMKKELGLSEPHIHVNFKKMSVKEKINYFKHAIFKFPYFIKNKDILLIGSTINNVYENGYFTDRFYDCAFELFQNNTLLCEISSKFRFYEPRKVKTYYFDLFFVLRKIFSKIFYVYQSDYDEIIKFIKFLEKKIEIDNELRNYIKNRLQILSKYIRIESILWNYLLKKINPKIVFIECAHYGNYTNLIYETKKRNILVGEFQHGFIGKEHYAYNFHPNIHRSIKLYLPDYLLTFGDYWGENVNTPVKKISIGFPYLEKKSMEKLATCNDTILIVSGGTLPQDYIILSKTLLKELKNDKIIFRPHPSERPAINERYKELVNLGVEIDNDNLYERLKKVDIVISLELSTVLFEALLFTPKVFLLKSKITSEYNLDEYKSIFLVEDNLDSLISSIKANKKVLHKNIDKIWRKNSFENYKLFIRSITNNDNNN